MSDRQHLVLIADDDQAVRDALQFALKLEGLDVHTHSGGAKLLADPDLMRAGCVIVDDRMPLMDGFQLLSHLLARNIHLPSILLTDHATVGLYARATTAGVRKVLEKPLLDNALIESIRTILNGDARA
jgi:two-component system, LuxR family, response regulator FixJ